MDYRDNRQRWAEPHQVVHFYAGQWCTFTPALTIPSAYAGAGLRRRSSIKLRIFWNKLLGTATSAN